MIHLLYILFNQLPIFGIVYQKAFAQPLSSKEEAELIKKMVSGDQNAREKLICHNLRLVAHIAKKYENNLDDFEDLISIGTIGLMKAVDSFHDDKDTKLGTYAARCITNEILMHLRTNKKRSLDVSINEPVAKDSNGVDITILDLLATPQVDYSDALSLKENISQLFDLLNDLDKREREIIELRYGLGNNEAMTQKEVASMYKISRSYVSRIEKRALLKLYRGFMKTN